MKTLCIFLTAVALAAGSTGVANAVNLLSNGELDSPGPGLPITSWTKDESKTFSGPTTDLITLEPWIEIGPVTNGGGDNDLGGFVKAFQGNSTTGDLATMHLYQDVAGAVGVQYVLTGWYGGGANYSGLQAGPTRTELAIEFDNDNNLGNGNLGSAILDVKAAGLTAGGCCDFGAQQFSVVSGAAPAGTAFVRARASMIDGYGTSGGDQALFIDDFSLSEVPEPASVALGLMGMLALAGLVRKR